MEQMLNYVDLCGGQVDATHLVLMPALAHRVLQSLLRRAYVRQNNTFDIVVLPRDLDQRQMMRHEKLVIPDFDNL